MSDGSFLVSLRSLVQLCYGICAYRLILDTLQQVKFFQTICLGILGEVWLFPD